ncbi:MAG: M3 family oligoendopeptidase [Acholeplasmatales bacterium]|nr:MAG: M3 family oligoendopeptidase [Acholeplasmatales bacterium]
MTFKEYPYQRPDMQKLQDAFKSALDEFETAESAAVQSACIDTINQLRFDFNTQSTLAYIRHSINTEDPFYDEEKNFFNQNSPVFSHLNNLFYQALTKTPFRDELKKQKGDLLFKKAALSLKTFSPDIMPDLQEENRLASDFQKLYTSAQIDFEGKKRTLTQMGPFAQSKDRAMRKKASQAVSAFMAEHESQFDAIYDQLVKVRTKMAKTLGYDSFVPLAYNRWGRMDYGPDAVKRYREQVLQSIVPLNATLSERKRKRLKLDTLYHYDLALEFESGNPTPKGKKDWLLKQAEAMYKAMAPETDTFFQFMQDHDLLDLEAKKGKAGGGYCTFLPNYGAPFIFANFNGTKGDVDVLTHEAGHAFQMFMSRHHEVPEYLTASLDIMEIHSMSMEFFAWPWVDKFFLEDTEKYKFTHLTHALSLIAYASAIDDFQHVVYENPDLGIEGRKKAWQTIDRTYFPHKVYDDNDYLKRGNGWQSIMHLYAVPFYMIDYALAQVCAFQYWVRAQSDQQASWDSYLSLCKAGGSDTFLGLLKLAGLNNPFEAGTMQALMPEIKAYLDGVDDTKL